MTATADHRQPYTGSPVSSLTSREERKAQVAGDPADLLVRAAYRLFAGNEPSNDRALHVDSPARGRRFRDLLLWQLVSSLLCSTYFANVQRKASRKELS